MKNLFKILFPLFILTLAGFQANAKMITLPVKTNNYVILPAGTAVFLETNQEISSSDMEIGNTVEFTVRHNVIVNGMIVIQAGSTAYGKVKQVKKRADYYCQNLYCTLEGSSISITVESVQAVDGGMIYLNATPLTKKAPCKAEEVSINIGTQITARVRDHNNVSI